MTLKRRHILLSFWLTIGLAVVCAVAMPFVNVNSDMTRYLPNSSKMKEGLGILQSEFSDEQISTSTIKIMTRKGFSEENRAILEDRIYSVEDLSDLQQKYSSDSTCTLYELTVPTDIDQKALGHNIVRGLGREVVVETAQDGSTPPVLVLIFAAISIILVLIFMAQSWLDPVVLLLCAGIAVVLNIGTNALLPSVSITTNYIGAILQLVLSLDYSIVMMNRYRQEKNSSNTSVDALNAAMRKAAPSILSSALTTIVGLLMLVFMRMKIGADMGIVLAKGVLLSLVCTFTVLPALLMLFHKGVMNTSKRTFVLPTDRLSRWAIKYKVPLAAFAVALFAVSFVFSRKTEISFSTKETSEIEKTFPQPNPFVVIYDTAEQEAVLRLADSLCSEPALKQTISYPTLLQRQYTDVEMYAYLLDMMDMMGQFIPPTTSFEMLSPDLLRVAYYLKYADLKQDKLTFPELAGFLCEQRSFVDGFIDEGMREKLELFSAMSSASEPSASSSSSSSVSSSSSASVSKSSGASLSAPKPSSSASPELLPADGVEAHGPFASLQEPRQNKIPVISFMRKLYAAHPNAETRVLYDLSDTSRLSRKMNIEAMSEYIGSSKTQTKMVYSFSKDKSGLMTPVEYVHFLCDDLFNRKALAAFVSASQKKGLQMRCKVMDWADQRAKVTEVELRPVLDYFGLQGLDIQAIAFPAAAPKAESVATPSTQKVESTSPREQETVSEVKDTTALAEPSVAHSVPQVQPKKTKEELREEFFGHLMTSGAKYTPEQMARNFHRLGENIPENLVELLYAYYGSANNYDETWTMSPEQLLQELSDALESGQIPAELLGDNAERLSKLAVQIPGAMSGMRNSEHSLLVLLTDLPDEAPETYTFAQRVDELCSGNLDGDYYMVGESAMYYEMRSGFSRELALVTILTVLAIFLIIAITFRSFIVPLILVVTVMTAVYVNVIFAGLVGGNMLYIAYLIVQSILMGATIDYGILFANYYKEERRSLPIAESVRLAYRCSIRTIMTSGLIMIFGTGVLAILSRGTSIASIVGCLAVGAFVAIALILLVLPGTLAAFDSLVVRRPSGRRRC